MSDLIWLPEAQMRRIEPHVPLSPGVQQRVDDRGIVSGIMSAIWIAATALFWLDQ